MAVNDIVDLLRMWRRGGGEELERAAGPEALTLVEEINDLIQDRLRENDMYVSLWDEFDADPESNRAELIGALEAAVEGDAEFAARLMALEEDYDRLALAEGEGQMAGPDAGALLGGHLEGDAALIGEAGSALTAGQLRDEFGGEVVASQGDWGGETMLSPERDASPLTGGESLGENTYIIEQALPDEDREDAHLRPGSLYDATEDNSAGAPVLTTGDIRSLIQPVEMALEGELDMRDRDRRLLRERLRWVEKELQRGAALDAERLRGDMLYVRDAAPDLWDVLLWNLRDVGELLPVSAQGILTELAGPTDHRAAAERG